MNANHAQIISQLYPGYRLESSTYFEKPQQFLEILVNHAQKAIKNDAVKIAILKKYGELRKRDLKTALEHLAADLRNRMDYRREPRGLEIINTNWEKILSAPQIPADCDDFSYIISVIGKTLFPAAHVYIKLVSMQNGKSIHHAFTVINDGKKRIAVDVVRKRPVRKKIYLRLSKEV